MSNKVNSGQRNKKPHLNSIPLWTHFSHYQYSQTSQYITAEYSNSFNSPSCSVGHRTIFRAAKQSAQFLATPTNTGCDVPQVFLAVKLNTYFRYIYYNSKKFYVTNYLCFKDLGVPGVSTDSLAEPCVFLHEPRQIHCVAL